jgi:hypothetical protein
MRSPPSFTLALSTRPVNTPLGLEWRFSGRRVPGPRWHLLLAVGKAVGVRTPSVATEKLRNSWWLYGRGSLAAALRPISRSRACAATPRLLQSSPELEVGRVEGAGVPALAPAAVGPFDQPLGQLGRGDPDVGSEAGVLIGVLGLQPRLPYAHRGPAPLCGTTASVESYGVKVSDARSKT